MLKKGTKKAAAAILIICIIFFATNMSGFSNTVKRTITVTDVPGKVLYNEKELQAGSKLFVYNNEIYMPLSFLKDYFNKSVDIDISGGVVVKDKPDAQMEALKTDAAKKDARIKELEDKAKTLEAQLSDSEISMSALEARLNNDLGEYQDMEFRYLLSGDEHEVRIKIEADMDSYQQVWGGFDSSEKLQYLGMIYEKISEEYPDAIMKGFIKDISRSRTLLTFTSSSDGSIKIGSYRSYSKISELEEKFNRDYDDLLSGINLTYKLEGNENTVHITACIQNAKYGDKWNKLSDITLKNALKKVTNDVSAEFSEAKVNISVYDTDTGSTLIEAWKYPSEGFGFSRN